METYLTLLYVTFEQELALKQYFLSKGWTYCKPDLNVLTDRVGPFENPQALKTRSGNIVTYNEMSPIPTTDIPMKARSKIVTDMETGGKVPVDNLRVIKVEVAPEKENTFSLFNDYEYMEELPENDDGDNDDDYADDLNDKNDESEKNVINEDNLSRNKHGREAEQYHNVGDPGSEYIPQNNQVENKGILITATGRKTKRMAAKAEETTKTLKLEETEESDNNVPVVDKHYLRQLIKEALKSSKSGKESSKTDFAICPQCQKSIRNTNLRRHLVTHFGLPYRCTRCSSYYKSQDELQKHRLDKHIGEFICTYCGVKYRFKNSLTEHVQSRHEGTAKLYQCTVCGVKMCRKSHMDDHMNIHNNVNPYCCDNCNKTYKNKSAFKRHTKDCGSGIKYVCNACGQIYKSSAGLQDHIKRCHADTNRFLFPCLCGTSFKNRAARCRHRIHCEKYQREKNGAQNELVQQNIAIVSVTNSHNEHGLYGNKLTLGQAGKEVRDQNNVVNSIERVQDHIVNND